MKRRLYDYRFNLYINDVLVDFRSYGSLYYNEEEDSPKEVDTFYNYSDFMNCYSFDHFYLETKKFGTLIKVGKDWIKKKDIKTIKIIRTIKPYTKEYIDNHITFYRLSKELKFEEFKNYCIDNGFNVVVNE